MHARNLLFHKMYIVAAIFLYIQGLIIYNQGVLGNSNKSFEHQIRASLLVDHDKTVLPILGNGSLDVSFGMKISRLVKVDNKEQIVVLDTWVIQLWKNEFLKWKAQDFGGMTRVRFLPEEVWVPDISLFNNGDEGVTLAGGRTKFVTEVSVDHEGNCVWSGPATFKANCDLVINEWPLDSQSCQLGFGSFSYGIDKMKIKLFKDTKGGGQFTNRFVSSGDWDIKQIDSKIDLTDHGDCCPFEFSEVVYTLYMTRKPLYHLFYLTLPSSLLMILALTSFFIPVESGERVGFVTTILLAMIVFLLLIPSFLPETSDGVPMLGIGLQATMIIISLVLFANIFVLKVFFMEGTPPESVQNLFTFCRCKKGKAVQRIHTSNVDVQPTPPVIKLRASMNAIELSEQTAQRKTTPSGWEEKGEEITWQKVSVKLDHIFFVIFFLVSVLTYIITYLRL